MEIEFTKNGWRDYEHCQKNHEEIVARIKELLRSIQQKPFKGMGKPEPLRHGLRGFWSRRLDQEHRLVYRVEGKKGINQKCTIIQCRFHY